MKNWQNLYSIKWKNCLSQMVGIGNGLYDPQVRTNSYCLESLFTYAERP